MTRRTRIRLTAAVAVAAVGASTLGWTGNPATAQAPPPGVVKQQHAAVLTTAPDLTYPVDAPYFQGLPEIRRVADPIAATIPLPDGGNFNGIHWTDVEGVHMDDILFVLQYNAACQWYRAVADGRETDVARVVLGHVPNWPALRDPALGPRARELAGAATDSAAFRAKIAECTAEHGREVGFARRHGFKPPR